MMELYETNKQESESYQTNSGFSDDEISEDDDDDEDDDETEDGMLDLIDRAKSHFGQEIYSQDELMEKFKREYKKTLTEIVLPLMKSSYHAEFMRKLMEMKQKYKNEERAVNHVIKKNKDMFVEMMELYQSNQIC